MRPDRIVREHTVISAGGSCASFRRMDDAEVGAAIALGANATGKREPASFEAGPNGGQIKRGGDRIAPAPPRQCGRVDRRSPSRIQQLAGGQPFMHSLCALARSSAFMPAVFLLHIAILLSGFAGLADRQGFIKALRLWAFMSFALSLPAFISSCRGVMVVPTAFLFSAVAANAGPKENKAAKPRVRIFFMEISWEWFLKFG